MGDQVKAFEKRRFRPTYPDFLHGAPPISACAAFIKESRMKLANARKLDRKSGVRWCERGTSRRFPPALLCDSIWHYNCYVSLVTSRVITPERRGNSA